MVWVCLASGLAGDGGMCRVYSFRPDGICLCLFPCPGHAAPDVW